MSCICELGASIVPLYMMLPFNFGTVLDCVIFPLNFIDNAIRTTQAIHDCFSKYENKSVYYTTGHGLRHEDI